MSLPNYLIIMPHFATRFTRVISSSGSAEMIRRDLKYFINLKDSRITAILQDFIIIRPAASTDFCELQTQHAVVIVPSSYTSAEESLLRRPEMASYIAKTTCYSY